MAERGHLSPPAGQRLCHTIAERRGAVWVGGRRRRRRELGGAEAAGGWGEEAHQPQKRGTKAGGRELWDHPEGSPLPEDGSHFPLAQESEEPAAPQLWNHWQRHPGDGSPHLCICGPEQARCSRWKARRSIRRGRALAASHSSRAHAKQLLPTSLPPSRVTAAAGGNGHKWDRREGGGGNHMHGAPCKQEQR